MIMEQKDNCTKIGKSKVWRFVHQSDFSYKTNILVGRRFNHDWLSIKTDGTITVKGSYDDGYAWDGCTPKKDFMQITWGNFDGMTRKFSKGDYKPYTYYASMIHDILYQHKRCAPITRKEADLIFLELLNNAGFIWAKPYFVGVRALGWLYSGWKYKNKKDLLNSDPIN